MAPWPPLDHGHGPHDAHAPPGVRRVTLLVSRNGSLLLVPEDGPDGGGALSGLGALLVATFAGGLALNVLLVLALVSSEPRTRARAAQAMLMLANALDCLLNAPAAAVVVSSWGALVDRQPGAARALCRFTAVAGQ
ncbi:uncharacterized protein LOC127752001, partial [Frankliniella occidentalis]|uniref:Uncharacterized protein LOC127752001 n=1 Tax=Frankliniella occidentalis TaxID=133901 RepID=A0A9C6XC52_FRAOC